MIRISDLIRRKNWVLTLSVIILVSVLITGCTGGTSGNKASLSEQELLEDKIDEILSYYKENRNELESWWDVVALASVKEDITQDQWTLPKWDISNQMNAAEHAGYILAKLALSQNPYNIGGINLVDSLSDLQDDEGSFGDINSHMWSMIALDTAQANYNKEIALQYLISQQLDDGGFAFSGNSGDIDMTAMALIAFAPYSHDSVIEERINKAIDFLKVNQLEDGGFSSWGSENANSTAVVLSALIAVDEDVYGEAWVKEKGSIVDALINYQTEEGAISFLKDPLEPNIMATNQALLALGEVKTGITLWDRIKPYGGVENTDQAYVTIRIEGPQETVFEKSSINLWDEEDITALAVVVDVLERAEIPYELAESEWGTYIQEINGVSDAWVYKVNGELASVGVDSYIVNNQDVLVFYYGQFPPDTLIPEVEIISDLAKGQEIALHVKSTYFDWENEIEKEINIENAQVVFNGEKYYTDGEGMVKLSGTTVAGTYYINVSKDNADRYPSIVRTKAIPLVIE
ncbi:DUF4430 domain-containing protein [Serpentinicella sp. ANB-PHB4]|uniref:DUF4430 domain-containing protein n=1 Tax=Serpentinicella sp. ANB-PHB4 TaxID=3074076 RepID=UPI0028662D55|nr:DUF4430 domain-containing protein [Serpentinicella sp. ANB-PHB4]MDR5659300.1 DUF4430 domain-containing protein [Serpentinicella sp. ANB-PHB4]